MSAMDDFDLVVFVRGSLVDLQQQKTENSSQQQKLIRYSPFTPLSMRSD